MDETDKILLIRIDERVKPIYESSCTSRNVGERYPSSNEMVGWFGNHSSWWCRCNGDDVIWKHLLGIHNLETGYAC